MAEENKAKKNVSSDGWDVDELIDEIRVNLIFQRENAEGEKIEHHLAHIFKEPTAANKAERLRYLGRTRIDKRQRNVIESDMPGADSLLWSRCIINVEGYKKAGQTLDSSIRNWKDLIPMDHKSAAVQKLLQVCGLELDEDEAKN